MCQPSPFRSIKARASIDPSALSSLPLETSHKEEGCSDNNNSSSSLSSEFASVGCGIDRSCPASVTKYPKSSLRLDQLYDAMSLHSGRSDNEFDWYDLDSSTPKEIVDTNHCPSPVPTEATRNAPRRSKSSSGGGGLSPPLRNSSIRVVDRNKMEIDVFLWTISVQHNIGETTKDREFRETMEDLEQELLGSSMSYSQLSSSFCNHDMSSTSFSTLTSASYH